MVSTSAADANRSTFVSHATVANQFNELTQYGVEPVGEFTQRLTIRDQWLEIQVVLQNAQGEAELVGILVYYGLTPPPAGGDLVPMWLPREVLGQW